MAYDASNLNCQIPRMGDNNSAQWVYTSTDPVATVIAAGYIDDGDDKGMKVNDTVVVMDTDGPNIDLCMVTAIAANGDVTMINGT